MSNQRKGKFLSFFTISASFSIHVQRTDIGGVDYEITFDAGVYWPSDDGTADDLLDHIQEKITDEAEMASFRIQEDGDGFTQMFMNTGGQTANIEWNDGAGDEYEELKNYLGYEDDGDITAITDAVGPGTAPQRITPCVFFALPSLTDEPRDESVQSGSQAIDATQYVVELGEFQFLRYRVRFQGYHRKLFRARYHDFRTWWRLRGKPGFLTRFYPDATVDTPYVPVTNPWGYHLVRVDLSMKGWDPKQHDARSRLYYIVDMTFIIQTA